VPSHEQEIHVTSTDAFVLKNSDLNAFLYADVGTEMNGSSLTMLSVLARLGKDPWAEAARWTKLPTNEAFGCLSRSIGQMPLDARALAETNAIASRLLRLLPGQTESLGQITRALTPASAIQGWMALAFLCASLLMGLTLSMTAAPVPPAGPVAPPAQAIDLTAPITPK
jgi:hypothetical protein